MSASLASLLLPVLVGGPVDEPLELRYSGNLITQPRGEEEVAVKRFSLYALVTGTAESRSVFYIVEESGGGGWSWPERFGRVTIDAKGTVTGRGPKLLHTFNDIVNPIELELPIFAHGGRVQPESKWVDGKWSYEVAGGRPVKVAGRATQRVDVSTNFGRSGQLWLEGGSLVVKSARKLFLGRGDQFALTMELKSAEPVATGDLDELTALTDDLLALAAVTGRESDETQPAISPTKLDKLAGDVEPLVARAKGTPLKGLVGDIARDVTAQRKRTLDASTLATKFVGKPAPKHTLIGIDGKRVPLEADKPLLLHFWGYRGEALEEPYGQVGYIGFLEGKRGKLGLQVVGVALNEGANETEQVAIARSIRKFREFMRVDYPIAVDDGTLLSKFGDPRRIGATLPLWVLVDHEGRVASYHTGYYEADPNKGLVELDAAVVAALRAMRGRE